MTKQFIYDMFFYPVKLFFLSRQSKGNKELLMPSAGFLHSIYFLELMATIGTPMVSIGAYGKDILEATPVWKCPPRQLRGFLMLDESYFFPPRPFIASREGPLSSHLWVNLMFQSFHGRDSRLWREGRKESKHFLATPESPSNS